MKATLMVVLVGMTFGCASVVDERPSLLRNGGLEELDALTDLPAGWRVVSGTTVRRSTLAAHGDYSVEIGGSDTGKVLLETEPVTVTAGAYYTFSVAYYQPSGTPYISGARMEVRWLNGANALVHQHLIEGTAQGAWTRLAHRVAAPDGAVTAVIAIGRTHAPTTVYLDDVSLCAD